MSARPNPEAADGAAGLRFLARDPAHPDAAALLQELNAALAEITGSSGSGSFDPDDVRRPGAAFLVAYRGDAPVACGAFRSAGPDVAEVKRVYARARGAGLPLLRALDSAAREAGYRRMICETRRVNARAVSFYLRAGWREIEPYGGYVGRPEAVCLERTLDGVGAETRPPAREV